MSINMFKKRIKKSRATWLGLLLKRGNSRSKLRKHHSERGIAIPLVIGIGLLMLLLSITIVVRSQSSQINSSNLNQAASAGEVAETGVTRIQSLFAANRTIPLITLYDVGTSNSWVEASNSAPSSCSGGTTNIAPLTSFTNKAWIDIEAGKRQYRVFSYNYSPSKPSTNLDLGSSIIITDTSTKSLPAALNSNTYISSGTSVTGQIAGVVGKLTNTGTGYTFTPSGAPTNPVPGNTGSTFYPTTDSGVGRLQVEGRVIDGTVTSGATSAVKQVIGTSAIQVEIPVTPGDINNIPVPGTWVGTNFTARTQKFASNVLVPCSADPSTVPLVTATPPYQANKTTLSLPELPTTPSTAYTIGNISGDYSLPLVSNSSPSAGYNPATGGYDYIVNDFLLTGSSNLVIDPNYKVSIYLTGNMETKGTADIVHDISGSPVIPTSSPFTISGSSTISTPISIISTSAVNVYPSGTSSASYLSPNQSAQGSLGSNGVPGTLTRDASGNYTFTRLNPTSSPFTIGTIIVAAGSTFTPRTAPYKPSDFRIYGIGTTPPSATTPYICLRGSSTMNMLILAPSYGLGLVGNGNISGAVWVGTYPSPTGCPTAPNGKTIITQNATWDDIGLSPQNLPPNLAATQTWNKKEVN